MPTQKEAIYDEHINPLVAQIITICHSNKIAMLADFDLGTDDEGKLKCTTALLEDEYEPGQEMQDAFRLLRPKTTPLIAFTITTIRDP